MLSWHMIAPVYFLFSPQSYFSNLTLGTKRVRLCECLHTTPGGLIPVTCKKCSTQEATELVLLHVSRDFENLRDNWAATALVLLHVSRDFEYRNGFVGRHARLERHEEKSCWIDSSAYEVTDSSAYEVTERAFVCVTRGIFTVVWDVEVTVS